MKATALTLILISVLLVTALLIAAAPSTMATDEAPQLQWSKTFGYATACCVAQAGDGSLLIAAQSAKDYQYTGHLGFHYNNLSGILINVDLKGQVLWNKSLPILPKVMIPTNDGGFVIAGEIHTFFGYSETDVSTFTIDQSFASLIKIDDDGTVVWNQTYNLSGQPIPNPAEHISFGAGVGANVGILLQTSDGGYLLGGAYSMNSYAFAPWTIKPWLIKTDASGNSTWTKVYATDSDTNEPDIAGSVYSAVQTTNGGFLLVGNINGLALTKTDSSGNIIWGKSPVPNSDAKNYTTYNSIARAPDGGYLLVGVKNYYINNEGSYFAYLEKVDDSFNQVWNVTYDQQRLYGFMLIYSSNDSYFFSASSSVIKTDLNGNMDWSGVYNGTTDALCPTADGGDALAGAVENNPGSLIHTTYIWLGKLASGSTLSPSPSPLPFSTALLVAVIVIVLIVVGIGIGLFVHFKKRKYLSNPSV
jgi:hypothetical protein